MATRNVSMMEVMIVNGRRYLFNTNVIDGGESACKWILRHFKHEPVIEFDIARDIDYKQNTIIFG
jgi:hypothetical protein